MKALKAISAGVFCARNQQILVAMATSQPGKFGEDRSGGS